MELGNTILLLLLHEKQLKWGTDLQRRGHARVVDVYTFGGWVDTRDGHVSPSLLALDVGWCVPALIILYNI